MACQTDFVTLESAGSSSSWRHPKILLLIILLLAAFLRLVNFGQSPPGLNQDEAANAWSAYCLLKTGKDYTGASWPIYYMRTLGGNSNTLLIYMTIPFQAIGGLNVYTTRLPVACAGILTVWLIYFVAKKLFNIETGLAAAALLALNPWHLQQSRWGHDGAPTPLLGLIPLAGMLWANLPVSNDKNNSPRPVIAGISGILAGIGCFGYFAVRIFVPTFILVAVLSNLSGWWKTIKTKKGALAVALFVVGFTAIFGQLLYLHIFHPEGIGRHISFQTHCVGSASLMESLINVPLRYIQHFGLNFLFIRGDNSLIQGPPVGGEFHWYELPLMLAGAFLILKKFINSASLRTLAAFVLTYPIGDCLGWHSLKVHALRSGPGLCALVLLSAIGLTTTAIWLRKQNQKDVRIVTIAFAALVIGLNARFFYHFYGDFNRNEEVYHLFHVDLIEACNWLKPRFDDFDAVYSTTLIFNMPYVITTVALSYDPEKWFSEPIELAQTPPSGTYMEPAMESEWDFYTRYGKMHFIYDYSNFSISELQKKFTPGRLLLILRPGEFVKIVERERQDQPGLQNPAGHVVHRITRPDGTEVLWLCRF